MERFRTFKMSKNFKLILLSFFTLIALVLLLLAIALYNSYNDTGIKLMKDNNQKLIHQIVRNYNNMNEIVISQLAKEFTDTDVVKLMYQSSFSDDEKLLITSRVKDTVSRLPMYHSALIYNNQEKQKTTFDFAESQDEKIMSNIYRGDKTPRLMSVPMEYTDMAGKKELVFSYYIYDFVTEDSVCNGAFVLNIKTNWIRELMEGTDYENMNFLLIDKAGKVIMDSKNEIDFLGLLNRSYLSDVINGVADDFVSSVNGKEMVISSVKVEREDWYLICEQPFSAFSIAMRPVQQKTVLFTLGLLIVAFVLALFLAQYLYEPINKLILYVQDVLEFEREGLDDYKYLENALHMSVNKYKSLEQSSELISNIKRQNYFKLLLENGNLQDDSPEFHQCVDFIKKGNLFAVLMTVRKKIDWNPVNAILNQWADQWFEHYVIIPTSDCEQIVLIKEENSINLLRETFLREYSTFQMEVKKRTDIVVSLFLTSYYTFENINKIKVELNRLYKYEIMYSIGCCINQEIINSNNTPDQYQYPVNISNQLLQTLKNGNLAKAEEYFDELLGEIIKNDVDNFHISLMRLAISVQNLFEETSLNKGSILHNKMSSIVKKIVNLKGMDDVKEYFLVLFEMLCQRGEKNAAGGKQYALIYSVENYISMNYNDSNLSLNSIADAFKISPNHLGKIFKEEIKSSVADYINITRLNLSMDMLKETDYSIKEIIEKVGFINESGFYKLFKSRFGVTPREFRMNRALVDQIVKLKDIHNE